MRILNDYFRKSSRGARFLDAAMTGAFGVPSMNAHCRVHRASRGVAGIWRSGSAGSGCGAGPVWRGASESDLRTHGIRRDELLCSVAREYEVGAFIVGSRISPRGETLDRPSVIVASGDSTLGYPDMVFAGDHYLVAYPAGGSVLVRRVSRDGGVTSEPVVAGIGSPALLATNGKTVLLVTSGSRMRMLAADGMPLGVERVIPNAGGGSFQVGSNGDRYLIAYTNYATASRIGSLVLLGPNGDFLAAGPIPLAGTLFPRTISVASNGSSFRSKVRCVMAGRSPVRGMVRIRS